MAQNKIKINGIEIKQPDEDMKWSFETTYTSDTSRPQTGQLQLSPLFTVEAYEYTASRITPAELYTILQVIAKGGRFNFYRYSPYYNEWREDPFYVGQGNCTVRTLREGEESFKELTIQFTGINPI